MKPPYTVTIFGNFSAHNAGDDAILFATMKSIESILPDSKFIILCSNRQRYKLDLKDFNVKFLKKSPTPKAEIPPILRKTNLLQKMYRMRYGVGLFSYNSIYAVLKSDAVILSGGLFFDHKLFNPFFNFILPLYFLLPVAKRLKKYVITFNTGLGPIRTVRGVKMLKSVLNQCDLISLREVEGLEFIKDNHIKVPTYIGADPAISNDPIPRALSIEILKNEGVDLSKPLLGVNVNLYLDQWMVGGEKQLRKKEFVTVVSSAVKKAAAEAKIQPVMVCTNHGDLEITKELRDAVDPGVAVLDNYRYNHHELMGMMGCMDLLVGMRLHACVLAAAMGVPVVSINYAPKVKSFMHLMGLDAYTNEIIDLDENHLSNSILDAWRLRHILRRQIEKNLPDLKMKGKFPAVIIRRLFHNEPIRAMEWAT